MVFIAAVWRVLATNRATVALKPLQVIEVTRSGMHEDAVMVLGRLPFVLLTVMNFLV